MGNLKIDKDVKKMTGAGIPAVDTTGQDDGQPRNKFYVPSVMVERDVIANILDKFTKAGVSHAFQGDDLIIRAVTYSAFPQQQVLDDLRLTIIEVLSTLKDMYKDETGKALTIGKEEHEDFDCVSNYTTNHLASYTLARTYELPGKLAATDQGTDKGELPGSIPVYEPKTK